MTRLNLSKQDADVLEVLISQMGKRRKIYPVISKALRILGHAELIDPIRNLRHRSPKSSTLGEQSLIQRLIHRYRRANS